VPDVGLIQELGRYVDLWLVHLDAAFVLDPKREPRTAAVRFPESPAAAVLSFLAKRPREGSRYWAFIGDGNEQFCYLGCPAARFRHFVWKAIWSMGADGVAVDGHAALSGGLEQPSKAWEAFREGIEDVQWALMLKAAVRDGSVDRKTGSRALLLLDRLGCGSDALLRRPATRSDQMDWARLVAVSALLGLELELPKEVTAAWGW
jgi:hypothetical protein